MIAKSYNPYKDLTIYLPSSGRADSFWTINYLSRSAKEVSQFRVPAKEYKDYKMLAFTNKVAIDTHNEQEIPTIAYLRERLIKECKTRYILILDDDFRFFYRPNPKDWHLKYIPTIKYFDKIMEFVMRHVRKHRFAQASLSLRQGNHLVPEDWGYGKRYSGVLLYDLHQLEDIKLRRVPTMQDFDIAMQLTRKGRPSAVCYRYAAGEMGGNNAPGGASPYRTLTMQEEAAKKLTKLHTPYVKLIQKHTKSSWGGNATRYDVMMYHQKALKSSGLTIEEYLDGSRKGK